MSWLAPFRGLYRVAGAEADLSGIRVHRETADGWCRLLGARALTMGRNIFIRDDSYAPSTAPGLWLLAHEVAHVVQQRRGPVTAIPVTRSWAVGPAGSAEEREADAAADAVLAGRPFAFGPPAPVAPGSPPRRPVIQRYMAWEHVVLGNVDPAAIGPICAVGPDGPPDPAGALAGQCALLEELGRDPMAADPDRLARRFPGVSFIRLPASEVVVTGGELNVLPDYLSGPEQILSAPASFALPLVQAVRAQSHRQLSRIAGAGRGPRRTWSPLRYPAARTLADIREALEIDHLGRTCGFPPAERYLSVLARNACHFAPFSWHRWQSYHHQARQLILQARDASGERRARLRSRALVVAGYADHFLHDSFAAGHLINKTQVMQWYAEWISQSGLNRQDRARLAAMTCERQPDLHGPDLYDLSRGPAVSDPQTTAEAATLDQRIKLSGVRGDTDDERRRAYRGYLALLGSSTAQLPASVVHDHLNRRSLVVASQAGGPPYRAWGDRTLFRGGAGALAAAQAAQASRRAIADLLQAGQTDISSRQILARMPRYVEVHGDLVPLRQWHDLEVRDLCFGDLFGRGSTRARRLMLGIAAPRLGLPSADYAEVCPSRHA